MVSWPKARRFASDGVLWCVITASTIAFAACTRETNVATATTSPASAISTTPTSGAPTTTPAISTTGAPTSTNPTSTGVVTTAPATLPPVLDQRSALVYDHPELGPVTITIAYPDPAEQALIIPTVRATMNATGDTVFEWTGTDGYIQFDFAGAEFNPNISNPVDGRGHVFFEYDPGRYPGVSYLVPTPEGFDSNGTLGSSYDDGHYLALVVDDDGDGSYEIKQGFQNCDPDCASGYNYSYIWAWDGSAYTGPDADPGRADAVPLGDVSQFEPAKAAFTDYLLAVGARDYRRAWDMLEPEYQDAYGGFDKFTAFWDTIDSVGIETLDPYWSYGYTILEGTLWFELKDGTRQTEDVSVSMSYGDPPKIAGYTSYGATG